MGFNTSKCGVMHLGKNNPKYDYVMKEDEEYEVLTKTCEKDLGVYIDNNLNFKEHITNQVKKARCTAGAIHDRSITNKIPDIMVLLFNLWFAL